MSVTLPVAAGVSVALLCVGLFGAIWRRDAAGSLASVALMGCGAVAMLAAVSSLVPGVLFQGDVVALFVIVMAAVYVALGSTFVRTRRGAGADPGKLEKDRRPD